MSCSFVPSHTHRGTSRFGALSQSISVLQEEARPHSGLGRAVLRLHRTHQCCKKSNEMQVSTDQAKPGGQKHACLRSIKHILVFLNMDLEIYFHKGTVVPARAVWASLPIYSSHGNESRVGVGGIDEPGSEFGSEACRVPSWYLPASDTLFMQNKEHHVLRHCHCWKCCVNHGAVHSCTEWQRMEVTYKDIARMAIFR